MNGKEKSMLIPAGKFRIGEYVLYNKKKCRIISVTDKICDTIFSKKIDEEICLQEIIIELKNKTVKIERLEDINETA